MPSDSIIPADLSPRQHCLPFILLLAIANVLGCGGSTETPAPSNPQAEPLTPPPAVTLTVQVAGDVKLAEGLRLLRGEWKALSGGELKVDSVSLEEFFDAERLDGDVVINGGVQVQYKHQLLATDQRGECGTNNPNGAALGCTPGEHTLPFVRRDAHMWMPNLWGQLRYRGFRFETEIATIQGKINNVSVEPDAPSAAGFKTRSWGFVAGTPCETSGSAAIWAHSTMHSVRPSPAMA